MIGVNFPISIGIKGLTGLEKVNTAINKIRSGTERVRQASNSMFGSMLKANLATSAIQGLSSALVNAARDTVSFGMDMKALEDSIMFSGGVHATENLSFLNDTIEKMGLPLQATTDAFTQLSGSFMGTTLEGKDMRDIFEGVSMAGRALNMDNEKLKGTFLALSQMMSKGKVSAEELNGQLGERLPGALGLAAQSMGVTTSELMKMMQRGELMSEDFLPKFAEQLKKTFGEQALAQADQLPAKMNRLNASLGRLKIEAYGALEPLLSAGADFVLNFTKGLGDVGGTIKKVIEGLTNFLKPIIEQISQMSVTAKDRFLPIWERLQPILLSLVAPIQEIFAALMEVVGIVQPVIAGMLGGFLKALGKGNKLAKLFKMIGGLIRGVGQLLKFVFRILQPFLNGLAFLAGKVISAFVGIANVVGRVVGGVLKWLFGGLNKLFDWIGKAMKRLGIGSGKSLKLEGPNLDIEGFDKLTKQLGGKGEKDKDKDINADAPAFGGGSSSGSNSKSAGKGLEGITSSGSKATNITINIGKFQDKIEIHTTNLREGTDEIVRQLEEALLRTIGGVQQAVN